jgi:pilus assembly protein CpaE
VIALPADQDFLLEAIDRVGDTISVVPMAPAGTPATELPSDMGSVITVFSTKGGAGKSVIASNLAIVLARKADGPVVLVDADLQFGDVAVMLKMTPQHTIVDAVSNIHRLDAQLLQSLLMRHDQSGLLVLAAPVEPAFADQVGAADMVKIVKLLQTFCKHVVIDTPAHFNDVVLALLEESDDILLISGMDIPNIKNVKLGLQTLRLLNIPVSKLKLVLNRANSKVKLDVGEVERTLQIKADCLVPSDIIVPQSVNKGVPAVLDAPRSGVSKSMEQLAELFHAGGQSKRGSR